MPGGDDAPVASAEEAAMHVDDGAADEAADEIASADDIAGQPDEVVAEMENEIEEAGGPQ